MNKCNIHAKKLPPDVHIVGISFSSSGEALYILTTTFMCDLQIDLTMPTHTECIADFCCCESRNLVKFFSVDVR